MEKFAYTRLYDGICVHSHIDVYLCMCLCICIYSNSSVYMYIHRHKMIVSVGVACKHSVLLSCYNAISRVRPKSTAKRFFYSLSWTRIAQGRVRAELQVSDE